MTPPSDNSGQLRNSWGTSDATENPSQFTIPTATVIWLVVVTAALFIVTYFVSSSFKKKEAALGREIFERGEQKLNAGQPANAVEDLRSALLYSRDNPEYRLKLAQALSASNRTDEAFSYFRSLWDTEPGNGLINLELARLAVRKDNIPDALRYYTGAIYGTWNENPEAHRVEARLELIVFLLQQNSKQQAESELIALATDLPRDFLLETTVGDLFVKVQDYDRGLKQYEQALQLNPQNTTALLGAGRAAFQLGRYKTARHYLERAVTENPQSPDAVQLLETTNSVFEISPFERRLRTSDRASRAVRAFEQAGARLRECAQRGGVQLEVDQPTTILQQLYSRWNTAKVNVSVRKLNRNPNLFEPTMDLVFQIEQQTTATCGNPAELDLALLLVSRNREGTER